MKSVTLTTEHLILKTPARGDAIKMWKYYKENLEHFRPWSPAYPSAIRFLPFHRDWIKMERRLQSEETHLRFYIYRKDDSKREEIVGDFTLSNIIRGPFQSCFLGYKMAAAHTGKGWCSEAVSEGVRYVFETLNLHRVEANIMPRNAASIGVVNKLNFTLEGESKSYLRINGQWEDHLHFVKINPHWKPD